MQKKIMILALAFFLTITGFAQQQQEEEPVSPATVNAQQIYVELLGPVYFTL
jgi:hypothetical protein